MRYKGKIIGKAIKKNVGVLVCQQCNIMASLD